MKRDEEELESLSNEIRKKEEQVHKLKGTGMAKNQLEVIRYLFRVISMKSRKRKSNTPKTRLSLNKSDGR